MQGLLSKETVVLGALLLLGIEAAPGLASAQAAGPTPSTAPRLISRSPEERQRTLEAERGIVLDVSVTDSSGKSVQGLQQKDFTLLDNQQLQKIASFQPAQDVGAGARVILMLDAVNNSNSELREERKAIQKFLSRSPERLPVAISFGLLTPGGAAVGQASQDRSALITAIKRLHVSSSMADSAAADGMNDLGGVTGSGVEGAMSSQSASDTVSADEIHREDRRFLVSVPAFLTLAAQEESVPGRVLLIWMGTGWPLEAGTAFAPATPAMQQNYYTHVVDLATAMRAARMTVDEVASPELLQKAGIREQDTFHGVLWLADGVRLPLDAPESPKQAETASMSLPLLAYESGGQILDGSPDLAGEISACIADATSSYVLSFETKAAAMPDGYHSLQVKVDIPGVTVRTSRSYYAQP